MKFGGFYEHQLPRPWTEGSEHALFRGAFLLFCVFFCFGAAPPAVAHELPGTDIAAKLPVFG